MSKDTRADVEDLFAGPAHASPPHLPPVHAAQAAVQGDELEHIFGVCGCPEGDPACFYQREYEKDQKAHPGRNDNWNDAAVHVAAFRYIKANYAPVAPTKSSGELREKIIEIHGRLHGREITHRQVAKQSEWSGEELQHVLIEDNELFFQEIIDLFATQTTKLQAEARLEVINWLEADLKRLDSRNWSAETMALQFLVGSGKADDYQKGKWDEIVTDRRAAHALYAVLNNYKAQLEREHKIGEDGE